jgi:hypothetical protein
LAGAAFLSSAGGVCACAPTIGSASTDKIAMAANVPNDFFNMIILHSMLSTSTP